MHPLSKSLSGSGSNSLTPYPLRITLHAIISPPKQQSIAAIRSNSMLRARVLFLFDPVSDPIPIPISISMTPSITFILQSTRTGLQSRPVVFSVHMDIIALSGDDLPPSPSKEKGFFIHKINDMDSNTFKGQCEGIIVVDELPPLSRLRQKVAGCYDIFGMCPEGEIVALDAMGNVNCLKAEVRDGASWCEENGDRCGLEARPERHPRRDPPAARFRGDELRHQGGAASRRPASERPRKGMRNPARTIRPWW